MGIVTEDTPDYNSLPSPSSAAKKVAGAVVLGAGVTMSEHEHVDAETYRPVLAVGQLVSPAAVSTSSGPMFSSVDGNDVVLKAHRARRHAQTMIAAMTTSSTSMALLNVKSTGADRP